MYPSVLSILDQVAATNSPIEKAQILNQYKLYDDLAKTCYLALSPTIRFYSTHTERPNPQQDKFNLEYAFNILLNQLASRNTTGNSAKALISDTLNKMSDDDAEVVRRIILKDLRAGFGDSITNKVWPGLVPTFDFMLCDTDPTRIIYPAESQLKADGMRCAISIDPSGAYSLMSRAGKAIEDKGALSGQVYLIAQKLDTPAVFDGELLCFKDGKTLDRKTSNGILNKAIRGTIEDDEAALMGMALWDVNDPTGTIPYRMRLSFVKQLLATSIEDPKFVLINSKTVQNEAEALAHFKEMRRRGYEGTILKNLEAFWTPKRTKDQCKFKAEIEAEFKVTGFEYGTGKNAKRIGALFIESECGLIKSKVGIFKDFDEKVRDEWLTDMPKIVTVMYNERITDKSRKDGTESLFLPRVTAVRLDKDVANTRDEMIAIEKAILE